MGVVVTTEQILGYNLRDAKNAMRELEQADKDSFWGVGSMISKKADEFFGEIPTLFAGRSEDHRNGVERTLKMFQKEVVLPEHLVEVTPSHVDEFKLALMKRVSPVTVNKHLRNLRALFGRAVKRGYLARNPVSMVEFASTQDPKPRDLSFSEFGQFFHACRTLEEQAFFRMLAVTGMRPGELAVRKWEDLDLESHRILITGTKTGKARVAFLGEYSFQLLMEHRRILGNPISGSMFPPVAKYCTGKWSYRCERICAHGGLDHYVPKNFRSSYLPRGQELGRRFDVGDCGLGHSPQGIGARHYNPIDVALIRDYNEALDEALEDAFQEARNTLRASYVPPHLKTSQTGRTTKKGKKKQASA